MSYIPVRDRFHLDDDTIERLFNLAERIETDAVLDYHTDECGCAEGIADVSQCRYGAQTYGVGVLETLAALHAIGALDAKAALGRMPFNDEYHVAGVYCGEAAHCTEPFPGALPGTPYANTEAAR